MRDEVCQVLHDESLGAVDYAVRVLLRIRFFFDLRSKKKQSPPEIQLGEGNTNMFRLFLMIADGDKSGDVSHV